MLRKERLLNPAVNDLKPRKTSHEPLVFLIIPLPLRQIAQSGSFKGLRIANCSSGGLDRAGREQRVKSPSHVRYSGQLAKTEMTDKEIARNGFREYY